MPDNTFLLDNNFLTEIDNIQEKEIYASITLLSIDELPIEKIEGRIAKGGTVNIDSSSNLRRTCNLTVYINEEINKSNLALWGQNNKFKLEIGVKNNINKFYPEILWFPFGVYVITDFSSQRTLQNYTIQITGKDKMCLLNGDLGGNLPHAVDFGKEQIVKGNSTILSDVPVKRILSESIRSFGGELPGNILIKDVPEYGLRMIQSNAKSPFYLLLNIYTGKYEKVISGSNPKNLSCFIKGNNSNYYDTMSTLDALEYKSLNTIISEKRGTFFKLNLSDNEVYECIKFDNGMIPGYEITDLIYAGELIIEAGQPLTSLYDRIIDMLGDYQYYYDVLGHFVFEKKPSYTSDSWKSILNEEESFNLSIGLRKPTYNFAGTKLISSLTSKPDLKNLKNDFSIWSNKSDDNKTTHLRYAIDLKPDKYVSLKKLKINGNNYEDNCIYYSGEEKEKLFIKNFDEIQVNQNILFKGEEIVPNSMLEIHKEGTEAVNISIIDYDKKRYSFSIKEATETIPTDNIFIKEILISSGLEQGGSLKYKAIRYDWRELIYQMAEDFLLFHNDDDFIVKLKTLNPNFLSGKTGYEMYYTDIQGHWRELYCLQTPFNQCGAKKPGVEYEDDGWAKTVKYNPAKISFWFDFLDTLNNNTREYAVQNIGQRSKIVVEDKISSIYEEEIPKVIFSYLEEDNQIALEYFKGYDVIQLDENTDITFLPGIRGISANSVLNKLLYKFAYCTDSISLTTTPIFHLDANDNFYINDKISNISGSYKINQISYNLGNGNTMNISGVKTPEVLL